MKVWEYIKFCFIGMMYMSGCVNTGAKIFKYFFGEIDENYEIGIIYYLILMCIAGLGLIYIVGDLFTLVFLEKYPDGREIKTVYVVIIFVVFWIITIV